MASITILNISSNPINLSIYYVSKNSPDSITEKNTAYFGTAKFGTIEYPDDCTNILISVRIEAAPEVYLNICSLKFDTPVTKIYEFVVTENILKASLFEINFNDINNIKNIKFKNKTLNGVIVAFKFDIGGKSFIQRKGIKKNRGLTMPFPINAKNIKFTVYISNPTNDWTDLKTIEFKEPLINTCYELTRSPSTSKFLLNEVQCTTK